MTINEQAYHISESLTMNQMQQFYVLAGLFVFCVMGAKVVIRTIKKATKV